MFKLDFHLREVFNIPRFQAPNIQLNQSSLTSVDSVNTYNGSAYWAAD